MMEKYGDRSQSIMLMLNQFVASMGSKDPEGDLMIIGSLIKGASIVMITAPDFFPVEQLENKVIEACFRLITTK
jgi:hypothetical protein